MDVVAQAKDGTVLLQGRDANMRGLTIRYEPQTNKNTIGYWTKKDEWVNWHFQVKNPGTFEAEVLQGCGKGSGGSEVNFVIGDQVLKMTVEDTGHFQNFVPRKIGRFKLEKPGLYALAVRPQTKPGVAVMDLRSVTLRPVEEPK